MKFEALSKLFLSVFSADELRRFLRFTCGSELVDALPGNGSFATLAEAAVDVLDKRGLVTAALFQRCASSVCAARPTSTRSRRCGVAR